MSRNKGVICNVEKLKYRSQIHWLSADDRRSQSRSKAHISDREVVHRNGVFSTGFISRLYISLKDFPELKLRKPHALLRMKSQLLVSRVWRLV